MSNVHRPSFNSMVLQIYIQFPNEKGIAKVMYLQRQFARRVSYEEAYQMMWWAEQESQRLVPHELEDEYDRQHAHNSS